MELRAGDISRKHAWTLWGCMFAGERMQACRRMQQDWVTCCSMTHNVSGLKHRGIRPGLGVAQGQVEAKAD